MHSLFPKFIDSYILSPLVNWQLSSVESHNLQLKTYYTKKYLADTFVIFPPLSCINCVNYQALQ